MPQMNSSKVMIWIGRVITALPVLMVIMGIAFSFAKPEEAKQGFTNYGYPAQAFQPVLITEVVCTILYLIPQTAVLGAILLTGYLGGATATHVRAGEPWFMPVIVGVVVWLGIFFRDARVRALVPIRR